VPYRFTIRPLPEGDGGGYLIEFPDLPCCMSDKATIEQAITNGLDAMRLDPCDAGRRPSDPRTDPLRGGVRRRPTKGMPCQLVAPGRVLVSGVERLADSAAFVCSRPLVDPEPTFPNPTELLRSGWRGMR
jgi:hypothetical protein